MIIDTLSTLGRAIVPTGIRRILRGRKNSVRNRFYDDPKQRLQLWWHYKKGGNYISWYAKRLDSYNRNDSIFTADQALLDYLQTGAADLKLLKAVGLQPSHRLHEIGFGHGRSAQFIVEYLDAGRYSGNDITPARVRFASELFQKRGISEKNPRLYTNTDNSFDWLEGEAVDFVYANAVFGHMPDTDVDDILRNMRKIMKNDSVAYFAWRATKTEMVEERGSVKDWLRRNEFWDVLADRYGYIAEHVTTLLPADFHPSGLSLLRLKIKA